MPRSYQEIEFIKPWVSLLDDESAAGLCEELLKEVGRGHPLYRLNTRAIARRVDCDDVLFAVDAAPFSLAVVHLTFRGTGESNPLWPETATFATLEDWIEQRMKPDSQNYRS